MNTEFVHISELIDAHILDTPMPYRWHWISCSDGWTLVVFVIATGQQIRCTYALTNAPDVVDAKRAARRLYGLRKRETGTIGQIQECPGAVAAAQGVTWME